VAVGLGTLPIQQRIGLEVGAVTQFLAASPLKAEAQAEGTTLQQLTMQALLEALVVVLVQLYAQAAAVLVPKVKTQLTHLHNTLEHLDLTFLAQVNKGTRVE
jgi:uncharacterized protein YqgV (UPF0045/DUF77 family)